jgi:UDP-N-acetylglucosamine--N-acetylmuramyl-(pentapeptide) pyrophosphoryl-undecaprenol N-acetylglucosamine transferase
VKVVIVAGGTGGHFYPGLAVAGNLQESGDRVFFIVRQNDIVIPLLEREKIPFGTIQAAGFDRKGFLKNIAAIFKIAVGFFESLRWLNQEKPQVLLAMGGYLSVPVAFAARFLRIPILLHEQNVTPGLANRLLSRLAKRIAISFKESEESFSKKKVILVGNPIRKEFRRLPGKEESLRHWKLKTELPTLLVFGGSQGAHRINELILGAVQELANLKFQILHFTGPHDEEWIKSEYEKINLPSFVGAYCHEMSKAYAASDLVLCRAGASTISELVAAKKPAVLIPYPYATDNHQWANAQILTQRGGADVFEQKDLSGEKLKEVLRNLIFNQKRIVQMGLSYDGFEPWPTESAIKINEELKNLRRK